MLGVYFTDATTPPHIVYLLATVQGFGIFTGAMLLSFLGNYIGHWKVSVTGLFVLAISNCFFSGKWAFQSRS